ncbi:hypothetical protein F5Y16DRAFT_382554 [Xylariaceae sp. FL0255]|nr:hypothetical protein F5Y16DRAFT_382554 [Xylariaceae sp. FL0255]
MTFEQSVRFANDLAGLERIFRFFHSIVLLRIAYPAAFRVFGPTFSVGIAIPADRAGLLALQQRLDLARRYIRMFRFLDFSLQAQRLLAGLQITDLVPSQSLASTNQKTDDVKFATAWRYWPRIEKWVELMGRTFLTMYLLLETTTILDYMQVDGLHVWGLQRRSAVNVEAQRLWLFTLACNVVVGLMRIGQSLRLTTDLFGSSHEARNKSIVPAKKVDIAASNKDKEMKVKNRSHLGHRKSSSQLVGLVRGLLTNALDMVIPGVVVGWLNVSPGIIALIMFVTTLSTSFDIYERCGREIARQ